MQTRASHLLSDQKAPPFTHYFTNSTGICGAPTVQALAQYWGHSHRGKRQWIGEVWNTVRDTVERMKKRATDWEKVFSSDISAKGLTPKIRKELSKLNNKKTNNST